MVPRGIAVEVAKGRPSAHDDGCHTSPCARGTGYAIIAFARLAGWRFRLPRLLGGILLAAGRHTATAWFRAGGISDDFRRAYHTIHAVGCRTEPMAFSAWTAARPCLEGSRRLLVAIDDTPTSRYGPCVEGAGIHHNPSPGPASEKFVCGHVWVTLAGLAKHPAWGAVALPLEASLYVRRKDLAQLPPERKWVFYTKLEWAADQLRRLKSWAAGRSVAEVRSRLTVLLGGLWKPICARPPTKNSVPTSPRARAGGTPPPCASSPRPNPEKHRTL